MSAAKASDWRWVEENAVLAIHDRQLAEHGGADSIRDQAAIGSTLARPMNLAAYGNPDAADLAAAYIHGLAKNHPFIDGNKRTAWVTARVFLADNGWTLNFTPLDAIQAMEGVAAGRIGKSQLANWLRTRLQN